MLLFSLTLWQGMGMGGGMNPQMGMQGGMGMVLEKQLNSHSASLTIIFQGQNPMMGGMGMQGGMGMVRQN